VLRCMHNGKMPVLYVIATLSAPDPFGILTEPQNRGYSRVPEPYASVRAGPGPRAPDPAATPRACVSGCRPNIPDPCRADTRYPAPVRGGPLLEAPPALVRRSPRPRVTVLQVRGTLHPGDPPR
jgi:hypothetical protein